MSFVSKVTRIHSIGFTCDFHLEDFSVKNDRLIYTCECGQVTDCATSLHETLFYLNALCDSRFHNFVYILESKLVGLWDDEFFHIMPITSFDNLTVSLEDLDRLISTNFEVPFHPSLLFQKLTVDFEESNEVYPLIFQDRLLHKQYGCKFPFVQFYERGMRALTYQCKKCLRTINYTNDGKKQFFEL